MADNHLGPGEGAILMRILIVEDETMVARNLSRLIREIGAWPIESLDHAYSLDEAEQHLKTQVVDLLFLDLNLSGEDGFDLLSGLVARPFQTIIVSANIDQALRAFEYGVIDFVAKPFKPTRLAQALNRLNNKGDATEAGKGNAKLLGIKISGKIKLVAVEDITFIRAAGRYSELVLKDGTTSIHEKNLTQLVMILPEQFQRIHKSHIVNLALARNILSNPGSKYELMLDEGTILPVGRVYIGHLKKRLL